MSGRQPTHVRSAIMATEHPEAPADLFVRIFAAIMQSYGAVFRALADYDAAGR